MKREVLIAGCWASKQEKKKKYDEKGKTQRVVTYMKDDFMNVLGKVHKEEEEERQFPVWPLPCLLGCCDLPCLRGCWSDASTNVQHSLGPQR